LVSLRKVADSRTGKFISCFNIWNLFLHTCKSIAVCVLHLLSFNIGSSHWSIVYYLRIIMSFCLLNKLIKLVFYSFSSELRNSIWLFNIIWLYNFKIWRFCCFVILIIWYFILICFWFWFRILLFSCQNIHHRCYRWMLSVPIHRSLR